MYNYMYICICICICIYIYMYIYIYIYIFIYALLAAPAAPARAALLAWESGRPIVFCVIARYVWELFLVSESCYGSRALLALVLKGRSFSVLLFVRSIIIIIIIMFIIIIMILMITIISISITCIHYIDIQRERERERERERWLSILLPWLLLLCTCVCIYIYIYIYRHTYIIHILFSCSVCYVMLVLLRPIGGVGPLLCNRSGSCSRSDVDCTRVGGGQMGSTLMAPLQK